MNYDPTNTHQGCTEKIQAEINALSCTPESAGSVPTWPEAIKFVNDWLREAEDRETGGMPWQTEYKRDCARMIIDSAKAQNDLNQRERSDTLD